MGQSTNALLAFGVDFGDDNSIFPWHEDDLETWWGKQNGCNEPEVEYTEETKPLFHKYWEERSEVFKTCPIEEVTHCSGEYPMYILAIKDTKVCAYRGSPEVVNNLKEVNATPLLEFCTKYEIKIPTTPAWLLFSDWN